MIKRNFNVGEESTFKRKQRVLKVYLYVKKYCNEMCT